MYPERFFIPSYTTPFMTTPLNIRPSLFSRLSGTMKSINWSGLLNGADRTLGLVNQTIPLVREAKPMFSNMKSMVKLAKAFRNETSNYNRVQKNKNNKVNIEQLNSNVYDNPVRFFI